MNTTMPASRNHRVIRRLAALGLCLGLTAVGGCHQDFDDVPAGAEAAATPDPGERINGVLTETGYVNPYYRFGIGFPDTWHASDAEDRARRMARVGSVNTSTLLWLKRDLNLVRIKRRPLEADTAAAALEPRLAEALTNSGTELRKPISEAIIGGRTVARFELQHPWTGRHEGGATCRIVCAFIARGELIEITMLTNERSLIRDELDPILNTLAFH